MAQPAFRAAGTVSHTNGGSAPAPGLPSGTAEGDILLCHVIVGNSSAVIEISSPSGWVNITYDDGTNLRSSWFYKRAGASEVAPTIAITNNSNYAAARIYGFSGCIASGTPYEDATKVAETSGATVASATVTTTGADRLAFCMAGVEDDTNLSGLPPTGWTSRGNEGSNTGTDGRLVAIEYNSNPGSGNDVSAVSVFTLVGSEYWSTLTLLLIPVAVQTFSGSVATATGAAYDGTLTASGAVTFAGSVATATGQSYTGTVTATGVATFAGSVATATGQAYDGTLELQAEPQTFIGQAALAFCDAWGGTLAASGTATFSGSVASASGAAYDGTLTASGIATFSGSVATGTGQAHNGTITASGAVTFYVPAALAFCSAWGGTLTASGTATFSGSVAEATSQAYDGTLSGATYFYGSVATASGAAYDGTLSASGTATFSGSPATASGQAHDGTITATGSVTFSVSVASSSGQAYDGTVTASGAAEFAGAAAEATLVAYDGTLQTEGPLEPQTFVGQLATATASAYDGVMVRLGDSLNCWWSSPRGLCWSAEPRETGVLSRPRRVLSEVTAREVGFPVLLRQLTWEVDPS